MRLNYTVYTTKSVHCSPPPGGEESLETFHLMQYGVLLLLCGLGYFGGSIGRYKFNVTFGETLFSEFYRLGCLQVIYLCYFKATPRRGTETIVFLPSSRGRIANGWKKNNNKNRAYSPLLATFRWTVRLYPNCDVL